MSVTLLDNILNKNADAVASDFISTMNEKVAAAIEVKRQEIAQTMFAPKSEKIEEELVKYSTDELIEYMQTEDYEQLDEISKETLGKYIKAAHWDGGMTDFKHGIAAEKADKSQRAWKANQPTRNALSKNSDKRAAGIALAVKKLVREDVETLTEWAKAAPADETAAHELYLHGTNTRKHYDSAVKNFIPNLQKKVKKGTYDHEKAADLWKYHADHVAADYKKTYGGDFSVATRKLAAKHFRDHYDEHVREVKEETDLDESFESSITDKNSGAYKAKVSAIPSRRVTGASYGAHVKTDELGDEVYDDQKPADVKRGRGRPKKNAGSTGNAFSTDAISALLKAKLAPLPNGKSRKIVKE